ncbi:MULTISPECIES: hypothetical protein [unclassified Chelatococcus]|uniref:hypothetical protein n=1 Tax=unclassified Chelatococcus TaxID=2638111 RepID=UPI001BCC3198|nr:MULTISPECIES: hypothetical protein [unclassified Chelatococcus]MBS7699217.1 hypothetical protein [Chelatococcus sp. YT9]MBX3554998.1 hypothetical protein [Chelatococcus sp.]
MLRESFAAIVARNETWTGKSATEPYEAGWANEAVVFVRALKPVTGKPGRARIEISPDGMRWAPEGTEFELPTEKDGIGFARVERFGTWIRVTADVPDGAAITVLVTLHLKA